MPVFLLTALVIYFLFGVAIGMIIAYPMASAITICAILIVAFIHDIKRI